MKRLVSIPFLAVALLVCAVCTAQSVFATDDPGTRAKELDAASRDRLGIGVSALSLLLEASPGNVYNADVVDFQRRRGALAELEAQGFVEVREMKSEGGHYVMVERTPKGEVVAEALLESRSID